MKNSCRLNKQSRRNGGERGNQHGDQPNFSGHKNRVTRRARRASSYRLDDKRFGYA
jgi:hypothetical protein